MSPRKRALWLAKTSKFFKKNLTILHVIPFGITKSLTKQNFFQSVTPYSTASEVTTNYVNRKAKEINSSLTNNLNGSTNGYIITSTVTQLS